MNSEKVFNIHETNKKAIFAMQQSFLAAETNTGTVFDFDEMFVDTVTLHHKGISRGARILGWQQNNLPTYEELVLHGGTAYYAEIFGYSPEAWEEIMERIRATRFINRNAPSYHPHEAEIVASLDTTPLGVLTAKPGTQQVTEVMQEDMQRFGLLSDFPVALRPDNIPSSATTPWKIDNLCQISQYVPHKIVVMLDDSLGLARGVMKMNSQMPQNDIRILQVVMADGSLTKSILERGEFVPENDLGIYAATWEELPAVFDRINQEWAIQN